MKTSDPKSAPRSASKKVSKIGDTMRRERLEVARGLVAWRTTFLGALGVVMATLTLNAAMTAGPQSSAASTDLIGGAAVVAVGWLFLRRR